jgi:hypothetical protein
MLIKSDGRGFFSLKRRRTNVKPTANKIAAATPPSRSLPRSLKSVLSFLNEADQANRLVDKNERNHPITTFQCEQLTKREGDSCLDTEEFVRFHDVRCALEPLTKVTQPSGNEVSTETR